MIGGFVRHVGQIVVASFLPTVAEIARAVSLCGRWHRRWTNSHPRAWHSSAGP
jgi:hypothetical protein